MVRGSRTNRRGRQLIGALVLSMGLPGAAVAQDATASLDELLRTGTLQTGRGVYVTDAAGRRLKGRLGDVSATSVVIRQGGQAWTIAGAEVHRIELQDSLRNGIAYGMATVAVPMAAGCAATGRRPGECTFVVLAALPLVGIGGLVGGVVDALRHRTVYRNDNAVQASVAPILAKRTLGARMAIGW